MLCYAVQSELTAELRGLEAQSDVLQHPHLTDHGSTPPFPTDLGSLQQVGRGAVVQAAGTALQVEPLCTSGSHGCRRHAGSL